MSCRVTPARRPTAPEVTLTEVSPAPAPRRSGPRRTGIHVAAAVTVALGTVYLVLRPQAPDLPAQLARASAVSRGAGLWWANWYGGINTSTYSLVSAKLMNLVGVGLVGVLSTVVIAVLGAYLARHGTRPRLGAVAIAVAASANLYSGRITFAAGTAVALGSLVALTRGRFATATLIAAVTGLVSPLSALFELTVLAGLWLARSADRRRLLVVGAAAAAPVLGLTLLFGQPSYMPYSLNTLVFALLACGAVAVSPVPRPVRVVALVFAAVALAAYAVPSPIGSNAARIPMLAAAPVVIATARRGQGWGKALAGALVVWPLISFASDMAIASQPSAEARFYGPLLAQLPPTGTSTQRVEVLDPRTHGAAYYLSTQVPLARGWERQVDVASNGLFYAKTLDPVAYRTWLVDHAVGWVAVPTGDLDFGAVRERELVTGGLPYLRLQWSNPDWQLYRVLVSAPVASGVMTAIRLTDTTVELQAHEAGSADVRVPYSGLLAVTDTAGNPVGCVGPGTQGDSRIQVPGPGAYILTGRLSALGTACPAPVESTFPPGSRPPQTPLVSR
jgi:hypothetical protein